MNTTILFYELDEFINSRVDDDCLVEFSSTDYQSMFPELSRREFLRILKDYCNAEGYTYMPNTDRIQKCINNTVEDCYEIQKIK